MNLASAAACRLQGGKEQYLLRSSCLPYLFPRMGPALCFSRHLSGETILIEREADFPGHHELSLILTFRVNGTIRLAW
jgi:hypothetical protein